MNHDWDHQIMYGFGAYLRLSLCAVRRYSRISSRMHESGLGQSSGDNGDSERRASRRIFLQSSPETRSELDLHALDEFVLHRSEACKHLTKGARLSLARLATYRSFDAGETVCFPGQALHRVLFVLHGQVN